MIVAQEGRHMEFVLRGEGEWAPVGTFEETDGVLRDVAQACGFPGVSEYNRACQYDPAEVRGRLEAL